MLLERGLFALDMQQDVNRARTLFREVLESPGVPPRMAAEALWHMSNAYVTMGQDEVSLAILKKVGREFPGALPFSSAAAASAVELSRTLGGPTNPSNTADVQTARDMIHIFQAALKLDDAAGARAALDELAGLHGSLVFELAIAPPDEEPGNKRERETELEQEHEFLAWVTQTLASLENSPTHTVAARLDAALLAKMGDRSDLEPEDISATLYARRDALVEALGAADAGRTAAAAESLAILLEPLTTGPKTIPFTDGFTGELAAVRSAAQLAGEKHFSEALTRWRLSRNQFLNSGIAGAGMILDDAATIPPALKPRIVAALMHVEAALSVIRYGTEDGIVDAKKETRATLKEVGLALERLGALAKEPAATPCQKRLQRTIQRLTEAKRKLELDETDQASSLLEAEMYTTP